MLSKTFATGFGDFYPQTEMQSDATLFRIIQCSPFQLKCFWLGKLDATSYFKVLNSRIIPKIDVIITKEKNEMYPQMQMNDYAQSSHKVVLNGDVNFLEIWPFCRVVATAYKLFSPGFLPWIFY